MAWRSLLRERGAVWVRRGCWGGTRAGVGGRRNREGEMRRESWGRKGEGGIERRDNDK